MASNKIQRELVALANADYENQKEETVGSCKVNLRKIERYWGLKAGQLRNYRANHRRRKQGKITKIHE